MRLRRYVLLFAMLLVASISFTASAADPTAIVVTDLSGPWRYVVDDDPAYAETDFDDGAWAQLSLPGAGPEASSYEPNIVWLRRTIDVANWTPNHAVGFLPGTGFRAYEVYANGKLIGGDGELPPPGTDRGAGEITMEARLSPVLPLPEPIDGKIVLALRVGRAWWAATGPVVSTRYLPLTVGPPAELRAIRSEAKAQAIIPLTWQFLLGALILASVALHHLLLWFWRRSLQAHLVLSVTLFTLTVWPLCQVLRLLELASVRHLVAFGISANLLALAPGIQFLWTLLRPSPPPLAIRGVQVMVALGALAVLVPGGYGLAFAMSPVRAIVQSFGIGAVILTAMVGFRTAKARARIIAIGFALAALMAIAQLVLEAWFVDVGLNVVPALWGELVVVLTLSIAMGRYLIETVTDLDDTNIKIGRFISKDFLRALNKESIQQLDLGDATVAELSVLFADLRGYSARAERLGPQKSLEIVNEFLRRIEPIITQAGGFLHQIYGDGVVALLPGSSEQAERAALEICTTLSEDDSVQDIEGAAPTRLPVAVGVHRGCVLLGAVGGGRHLAPAVVGDVVNTAARLQELAKQFETAAIVSAAACTPGPAVRRLGYQELRGKSAAVEVHELLDALPAKARATRLDHREQLETALVDVEFGRIRAAIERLSPIAKDDPPVRMILQDLRARESRLAS